MKTYDETVSAVFDRIRDYNVQKKRRTALACRVTAACCAVTLLGGSVWYLNRPTHDIPVTPATDEDTVTTTVTTAPTEQESTTTTANTPATETTTDGGIVTPPTTVTTVVPTTTAKPTTGKTEQTQTTTTTAAPQKTVITADEPDAFGDIPTAIFQKKEGHISSALKEKMKLYDGENVVYAVIVEIPIFGEDIDGFWTSTEELAQFHKEYYDVYYTFYNEAKRLNPTWDGTNANYIKVWTEELRENYQYWLTLIDKWRSLENQHREPYYTAILDQRVQTLDGITGKERIPISTDNRFSPYFSSEEYAFFMELTADEISNLAERGGYIIRLVFPDGDKIVDMPC